MKTVPIKMIELNPKGHLQIYPAAALSCDFELVYRDASGIVWDKSSLALAAREPERWEPEILFRQIVSAVVSEYGVELQITPTTIWKHVPESLKTSLQAL